MTLEVVSTFAIGRKIDAIRNSACRVNNHWTIDRQLQYQTELRALLLRVEHLISGWDRDAPTVSAVDLLAELAQV